MAVIKPFSALRFTEKAGHIQELCCPPYDIISEEQRQQFLKTNPNNVIRLELPKDGEEPYQTAGETLKQWISEGIVELDGAESIYIYEEAFEVLGKKYFFKGFISRVKLEEFSKGIILPHEQTLSKAKTDRFNLMCTTSCNFSQIYSLYIDELGETPKLLDEMTKSLPTNEFCDADGVTHRLWICTDVEKICKLSCQFNDRKLYIADGHHRYETGINYRNHMRKTTGAKEGDDCDYIMMMLVDMQNDGLVVFPTHRIIKNIDNFDSENLIKKCQEYFELENYPNKDALISRLEIRYNQGKKSFGYFDGKKYIMLTLKMDTDDVPQLKYLDPSLRTLDVSVLHTLILENLLGIDKENMANQVNLKYTRDAQEAVDSVNNGSANCCFIINPTRISEIADVAAAGEKMPQKSTYFYPKLITGLVMNKIKK